MIDYSVERLIHFKCKTCENFWFTVEREIARQLDEIVWCPRCGGGESFEFPGVED